MTEFQRPAAFSEDHLAASEDYDLPDLRELALVAVERTRMPIVVTDPRRPDNPIILANHAFMELTGYSADEIVGHNCRMLQGPLTERSKVNRLREALARDDDIVEIELINYRKDRTTFVNALLITAVRSETGQLLYHFACQKDVTAERKSQELEASERRLLMEVDHRTMNALSLIQSIVNLSQADNARGLSTAISGRVASLARTHRLLSERRWKSVSLADLVKTQISAQVSADRIDIAGETAELLAHVVQPVGLVIHELLSNAQIHGALADHEGHITLNWNVVGGALVLQWREEVAIPRDPVFKEGFGLQIIRSVVEHQLGGEPTVELHGNILEATFVIPGAVALAA